MGPCGPLTDSAISLSSFDPGALVEDPTVPTKRQLAGMGRNENPHSRPSRSGDFPEHASTSTRQPRSSRPNFLALVLRRVVLLTPLDQMGDDDRVRRKEDDPGDAVAQVEADRDAREDPQPEQPLVHYA